MKGDCCVVCTTLHYRRLQGKPGFVCSTQCYQKRLQKLRFSRNLRMCKNIKVSENEVSVEPTKKPTPFC
jgi:hypothetical protein